MVQLDLPGRPAVERGEKARRAMRRPKKHTQEDVQAQVKALATNSNANYTALGFEV